MKEIKEFEAFRITVIEHERARILFIANKIDQADYDLAFSKKIHATSKLSSAVLKNFRRK